MLLNKKHCNLLIVRIERLYSFFVSFFYFYQFSILKNQLKYSLASIVSHMDVNRFVFIGIKIKHKSKIFIYLRHNNKLKLFIRCKYK